MENCQQLAFSSVGHGNHGKCEFNCKCKCNCNCTHLSSHHGGVRGSVHQAYSSWSSNCGCNCPDHNCNFNWDCNSNCFCTLSVEECEALCTRLAVMVKWL